MACQRFQGREKAGLGSDHPAGNEHGLDDDGRDVLAVARHDPFIGLEIVERHRKGAPFQVAHAVQTRLEIRITAMIGADGLHDEGAPGHMPGRLHGEHARLRPGIGESQQFHRGNARLKQFGVIDLRPRRARPGHAAGQCGLDGLARRSEVVAMDQREPVAEQIHVPAAVDIEHPGPIAALDDHRIGRVKAGGAGVAARQHGSGLAHQRRRPRGELAVALLDNGLRGQALAVTTATASTSSLAPSSRSETPTLALAGQSSPKTSFRTLAYTA